MYETVPRPRDAFHSDERLAAFRVRSAHHDSTAVYVRFMKPNACTLRSTGTNPYKMPLSGIHKSMSPKYRVDH